MRHILIKSVCIYCDSTSHRFHLSSTPVSTRVPYFHFFLCAPLPTSSQASEDPDCRSGDLKLSPSEVIPRPAHTSGSGTLALEYLMGSHPRLFPHFLRLELRYNARLQVQDTAENCDSFLASGGGGTESRCSMIVGSNSIGMSWQCFEEG